MGWLSMYLLTSDASQVHPQNPSKSRREEAIQNCPVTSVTCYSMHAPAYTYNDAEEEEEEEKKNVFNS